MEAVIFVGVQGAGKSTFYKEKFFRTHLRISLDLFNKSRTREDILLKAAIEAKQAFVVDNTNPSIEKRKKYIELAKQARFKRIAYYFDVDFEDAMARNLQRTGKEIVPEVGLKTVLKTLQIPSCEEGFDEVYKVQLKNNVFVVEQMEAKKKQG